MGNVSLNANPSVSSAPSDLDPIAQMPPSELLMGMVEEYMRIEILEDLENTIEELYDQLGLDTGTNDAHAILRLAAAYLAKYQRKDSLEDLRAAAVLMTEAANGLSADVTRQLDMLSLSAAFLITLYERTESADDLSLAREHLNKVIESPDSDGPSKIAAFGLLGAASLSKFSATRDKADLNDIVRFLELGVELCPKSEPAWPEMCITLATMSRLRSEKTRDEQHFKIAMEHMQIALAATPDQSERNGLLVHLGAKYLDLYKKTHDPTALEKFRQLYEEAQRQEPGQHQEGPPGPLLEGPIERSDGSIEVSKMRREITYFASELDALSKSDPKRKIMVAIAVEKWLDLYRLTRSLESLDMSSEMLEESLSFRPDGFSFRRRTLLELADLALDKAMKSKKDEDLTVGVQKARDLLDQMPDDDPERERLRRRMVNSLGKEPEEYQSRARAAVTDWKDGPLRRLGEQLSFQLGNRDLDIAESFAPFFRHVDEADESAETGQDNEAQTDPDMPLDLSHLKKELTKLARNFTDRLGQGFERTLQKVGDGPEERNSPEEIIRTLMRGSSSTSLAGKFSTTSLNRDAWEAVEAGDTSISTLIAAQEDALDPLLGVAYLAQTRYLLTKDEAALDASLDMYQRALVMTSSGDDRQSEALNGIGLCFQHRAVNGGSLANNLSSATYHAAAIKACSAHNPHRPDYLGNLGLAFKRVFISSRNPEHGDLAIKHLLEAVEGSAGKIDRTTVLSTQLSMAYMERYHQLKSASDLHLAIYYLEEARDLEAAHNNGRNKELRPFVLHNLGHAYFERHTLNGDEDTWEQAMYCMQETLNGTEPGHRYQASSQWILACKYHQRFNKTGDREVLSKALALLEELVHSSPHAPTERVLPGKLLFYVYSDLQEWTLASRAASTSLSLLKNIMDHSMENSDKQWSMNEFAGFASDAAAVALSAGESPYAALRLLEMGRALVMGSILDLRNDPNSLQGVDPKLAEEYHKYRDQIGLMIQEPITRSLAWIPPPNVQTNRRYEANKGLQRAIKAIQEATGSDSLMQVLSEDKMRALAAVKPIVIINISKYRCDAIIVNADKIVFLPLPSVTLHEVTHLSQTTTDAYSITSAVLEWLWNSIAKPVLNTLGFVSLPRDEAWPRVCWIPTGPLVRLPLHAAGYHETSGHETVLDRVISSYSISVTALVHAHNQKPDDSRRPERAVLIGMPGLHNAQKEIDEVTRICQGMQVQMPEPRTKEVLEALKDCDIFHFAGHGSSNNSDPSRSALILERLERLTVASLLEINLHKRRPFLAFLSACSTGQIKQNSYVDEGLHLIAACQVAGFQHVIGTLWKVRDDVCAEAAQVTYEFMRGDDMSHASVSEGLHRACRKLRADWIATEGVRRARARAEGDLRTVEVADEPPLLWVPYVHYGI